MLECCILLTEATVSCSALKFSKLRLTNVSVSVLGFQTKSLDRYR